MAADDENSILGQTSCGSLLQQLQHIWDEVGENDEERDKMLLQLEQECLDVYKRKVEQAVKSRAQLLQTLADARVELTNLLSALGEKTHVGIPETTSGTIKEQLAAIAPALEKTMETEGGEDKRIFRSQLQDLQKEKSERLHKVLEFVSTVHDLCAVLGMDFFTTVTEVHPSLNDSTGVQSKSISNDTLSRLAKTVLALKEDKKQRLQKLQELANQLIDLWNLMDTPQDERSLFDHVTCNISASVDEVSIPGALALDLIEQAEIEVERLDQLKASRMKEIAFKKQGELEEIFARAHIEIDTDAAREKILGLIDSGNVEPVVLLADMDNQIARAKEEALSRREILDKVEKWMSTCEEESWLEDYSRDENRYNASRGAHLNLKRAEKARILVNKIPALVDTLIAKTRAWEQDRGITFTYDGVPLLAMLDEYAMLRQDREEEKKRLRDQKKFHDQMSKEQEAIFGATPSPARQLGTKKVVGPRANGGTNGTVSRRLSLNAHQNGSRSVNRDGKRDTRPVAPLNYVAISKEDAASHISGTEHIPSTPSNGLSKKNSDDKNGGLTASVLEFMKPRCLWAASKIKKKQSHRHESQPKQQKQMLMNTLPNKSGENFAVEISMKIEEGEKGQLKNSSLCRNQSGKMKKKDSANALAAVGQNTANLSCVNEVANHQRASSENLKLVDDE
ncbi:65-kDa microtubule-associated protein 1 [Abeliophyllum distichum]|uniref:65-kDa microtubule-associated protein 1 n=1 Tax=Abeliophyllum distichum TaxID=126358 RepID=A0ABD1QIM1_9LAMI